VISMRNSCCINLKALFHMLLVQEMPAVKVGQKCKSEELTRTIVGHEQVPYSDS
jgi:hypothetical protein